MIQETVLINNLKVLRDICYGTDYCQVFLSKVVLEYLFNLRRIYIMASSLKIYKLRTIFTKAGLKSHNKQNIVSMIISKNSCSRKDHQILKETPVDSLLLG